MNISASILTVIALSAGGGGCGTIPRHRTEQSNPPNLASPRIQYTDANQARVFLLCAIEALEKQEGVRYVFALSSDTKDRDRKLFASVREVVTTGAAAPRSDTSRYLFVDSFVVGKESADLGGGATAPTKEPLMGGVGYGVSVYIVDGKCYGSTITIDIP
jgi:hypothetical protein